MEISYNKLRKLMVDNQISHSNLMSAAKLSSYMATKINKNETVAMEALMLICKAYNFDIVAVCVKLF